MSGFQARVQTEYNKHPVGMYMGPYDQNKNLELKIQLPDSNLNFKNLEVPSLNPKCSSLDTGKLRSKFLLIDKADHVN